MGTDENGRLTTYEYEKPRNHTGTTYANGDETTFTYNEKNNVTSYTDTLGRLITYDYDLVQNETKTISPNGRARNVKVQGCSNDFFIVKTLLNY